MIKKKIFPLLYMAVFAVTVSLQGCKDDDYSQSQSDQLTFSTDKISMDSVFCNVPSPHKEFWAFNRSGKDILISEVLLQNGAQSGFRVNVDGINMGQSQGFRTSNVEVLKNDSIRVYVELTATENGQLERDVTDELQFCLLSGLTQTMPLSAHAFQGKVLQSPTYSQNDSLDGSVPLLVYGKMTVAEGVTLKLKAGTKLFFDDEASLEVHGTLICEGDSTDNVVLRGNRLDYMLSYLPYDRVSGQWGGVHFYPESYNNRMDYTDLHGAYDGIVCDSSSVDQEKLRMFSSTVHNCQGYCISTVNSQIYLSNCQITNALYDCLCIDGGVVGLNNCTLGQFYPFDSERGVALRYITDRFPTTFVCMNSIVTGYGDDELMLEQNDTSKACVDQYTNCILHTTKVEDENRIINTTFESSEDSIQGEKHFLLVDFNKQDYDFHLRENSTCVGKADPLTATQTDRDGYRRKEDSPSIGAFEYR